MKKKVSEIAIFFQIAAKLHCGRSVASESIALPAQFSAGLRSRWKKCPTSTLTLTSEILTTKTPTSTLISGWLKYLCFYWSQLERKTRKISWKFRYLTFLTQFFELWKKKQISFFFHFHIFFNFTSYKPEKSNYRNQKEKNKTDISLFRICGLEKVKTLQFWCQFVSSKAK